MNKRDKFWLNKLYWFSVIIIIFASLSLYNIVRFNHSYMEEEMQETAIFQKQIEWVITPYLQRREYNVVRKYCEDFKNENIKFRIFDNNKKLIASSKGYDNKELLKDNVNPFSPHTDIWEIYKHSIRDKMICHVEKIKAGKGSYYLEITISEEDVMKSIIKAQQSIWLFLGACLILLISSFVYIIQKIRLPFNRLQESVTKISNGEIDTEIEIPDIDILQELAISVKKMTKRLRRQITRLKQLEEYKTDFIQNISHEIKTPITAINSAVELIETGYENMKDSEKECFKIISYQVKYLNALVNDILSLAEIETEKNGEKKDFKLFNLNQSIKNTINYSAIPDIKIEFKSDKEIELYGDEELINRAILNLINNAIRYSQSEKIDVILVKNEKTIEIHVKDYGIGIEEKYFERLFERFYRIDKARSRKTGGTGLGLAIVKNIAELHNGNIHIESRKGSGADFIIELPRIVSEESVACVQDYRFFGR